MSNQQYKVRSPSNGRTRLANGTKHSTLSYLSHENSGIHLVAIDILSFGLDFKMEGVYFEEGPSGLLSTPSTPNYPSLGFFMPQKNWIWRHFLSAVIGLYSEFSGFYIQMMLNSEIESLSKRLNSPDQTKTDSMMALNFGGIFATFLKFRSQNQLLGRICDHFSRNLEHWSPYIEYKSPVCYCRKCMCRVKVFLNVGQRSWSRSHDQN